MATPPDPDRLLALARLRWAVVAMLIACALLSWARDPGALPPALARAATPVAIGLGLAIVVVRQWAQRASAASTQLRALGATYGLCAALGLFGAVLALAGDDGERGTLFALGGAIFAIGTPPGLRRG